VVDRVVGLEGVRTDVAFMQIPDGHGRLELIKFRSGRLPARAGAHGGIRHRALAVEDIDAVVAGLRAGGAELVGELERYEDSYRLCYVRGPGRLLSNMELRTRFA
jgi:glyoxalase/bleomycin resistance protein/dioxygenase superfamily protein